MKNKLFLAGTFFFYLISLAWGLTAEEIINKVDNNLTFRSARFESKMVIHVAEEVRTKELISYALGRERSFAEFLSPPRDRGVKFLKIEDNMWMYLPSVDKVIKIAGHMLRQSMMGSDFSYEDVLESSKLLEKYEGKLISEEVVSVPFHREGKLLYEPRTCYVIDLTAKVKEVTYYQRRIWVDQQYFIPVKEELFALSGKKLKVMTLGDIKKFGTRIYPTYYTMSNLLRKDSLTEMFVTKAQFDLVLDPSLFTQARLAK
jgi:outer membrane lipoprotein-sorting protein